MDGASSCPNEIPPTPDRSQASSLPSAKAKNHSRRGSRLQSSLHTAPPSCTVARLRHALKGKGIPFNRCHNKARLVQLYTTVTTNAEPPALPASAPEPFTSRIVTYDVTTAPPPPGPQPVSSATPASGGSGCIPLCACSLCVWPSSGHFTILFIPVFAGFTTSQYTNILSFFSGTKQ